jgi:hypothetical protein
VSEIITLGAMLAIAIPAAAVGIAGEPVMNAGRPRTDLERKFNIDLRDPQTVAAGKAMKLAVQLTAGSAIMSLLMLLAQHYSR